MILSMNGINHQLFTPSHTVKTSSQEKIFKTIKKSLIGVLLGASLISYGQTTSKKTNNTVKTNVEQKDTLKEYNEKDIEKCLRTINSIRNRENILIKKQNHIIYLLNDIILGKKDKKKTLSIVEKEIFSCKEIKNINLDHDIQNSYLKGSDIAIKKKNELYNAFYSNDEIENLKTVVKAIDTYIKNKETIPSIPELKELIYDTELSKIMLEHLTQDATDGIISHRNTNDPFRTENLLKKHQISYKDVNENLYQGGNNIEKIIQNRLVSTYHRSTLLGDYSHIGYNTYTNNNETFHGIVCIKK